MKNSFIGTKVILKNLLRKEAELFGGPEHCAVLDDVGDAQHGGSPTPYSGIGLSKRGGGTSATIAFRKRKKTLLPNLSR